MYEMKEGDLSIFKNEKKTADNQPDYTGKCMINGKEMRVACWVKKGEKGSFFAGKISEFKQSIPEPGPEFNEENDLPF